MFEYINNVVAARDAQPEDASTDLVMRSVQRRCHRLAEAAAAAWAAAGAPRRGEAVVAVGRAFARLAAAYGDAAADGDAVWAAAIEMMEFGWSELHKEEGRRYLVPVKDAGSEPRNELYRAAALAAADLIDAGDRLDQLLDTEELETSAHPEWAEKARRW